MAKKPKRPSIHTLIYNSAKAGDFDNVKSLYERGGNIDMAIMGATDGNHVTIQDWAFQNGACLLWSMQQQSPEERKKKLMDEVKKLMDETDELMDKLMDQAVDDFVNNRDNCVGKAIKAREEELKNQAYGKRI
jgi:hypothetical protein